MQIPAPRLTALFALLALTVAQIPAWADPPIPQLTGRVVDDAHILDASTAATIDSQLAGYESATTNQVVVVTLPDLKGYAIEDWGLALIRGWGIGQKDKNNGVLLIVAPNQRRVRIEVGYGLEGQLPDATANEIIDNEIVPRFKAGDLPGGVQAGVNSILSALGGKYTPTAPPTHQSAGNPLNGLVPFGLIAVFLIVTRLRRRYDPTLRRYAWSWGPALYYGSGGGFSGGGFSSGGSGGFSGGGGSGGGGGASGGW